MLKMKIALITMSYNHDKNGMDNALMPINVNPERRKQKMKKNIILISSMLLVLLISVNASAVSIPLNVNNIGLSGGPWGLVTLTQDGLYEVDFSVDAYPSAFDGTLSNFGIQVFGFNENTAATLAVGAPTGWSVSYNGNLDGFGTFNIVESGTGSTRQDPLSFSVTSPSPISESNFNVLNVAGYSFAAHIADFTIQGSEVTSGWFSNGPSNGNGNGHGVPEASTLLLLGSGLIGLWGLRRKFKK
jgi:hypothetical protein